MADYLNIGFGKDDFYNISVSLKVVQCSGDNVTTTSASVKDESAFNNWGFTWADFLEPWTSTLFEPLTVPEDQELFESKYRQCNETLEHSVSFNIYPSSVINSLFFLLLGLVLLPLSYCVAKASWSFLKSKVKRKSLYKQTSKVMPLTTSKPVSKESLEFGQDEEVYELMDNTFPKAPPTLKTELPLNRKGCQLDKGDVGKFLSQTLDLLNTGLNRVLWKTSSSGSASSLPSPTMGRRWSSGVTAGRIQSNSTTSSLRRIARSSNSFSSMSQEEETNLDNWDEYEESMQRFCWRQSRLPRLTRSRVGGEILQQMLAYLQTNLSTDGGHWRASCMLASYLLKSLEKELQRVPNVSAGLKFVEFLSLGSACKGTKVGQPSEFDVLMVVQPACAALQEAMVGGKLDNIPSGKTVLVLSENGLGVSRRFAKDVLLQDSKKTCMLTKQTSFTAHGLIDSAVAEISSKSRKMAEKMPYRIQKIESKPSCSKILLDTKPIKDIGFDVDEICVNIIPGVCIADSGLQQLPLYAVPGWDMTGATVRSLSVPKRNTSIEADVMWSLCTTTLEEAYLGTIDRRMKLSGVDSCHMTVLQLLKTILQSEGGGQSSGTGISGYWLETVVNFLLLESGSEMWTYDRQTDRLSDAIIFFKQAVQNQRLPHFFISNPHLIKQFPYLKMFPWLSVDKQVNLMSSLTEVMAQDMLKQVEERIKTFPLKHVLSRQFSSDLWEYEFFVFS